MWSDPSPASRACAWPSTCACGAQVEAQTVFSQALQASMHQLAKDMRSSSLLDPASPADEMMDRSATLLSTYEQLQVGLHVLLRPL